MSQTLAKLLAEAPKKKRTRAAVLALVIQKDYSDGRTQQCYTDECNIEKIIARASAGGTITHLAKYEGTYSDFSDFDFHEQSNKLAMGNEIFAQLPAEIRREFGQNPQKFFNYVNDPANKDDLLKKLPGLARPGTQLPQVSPLTADAMAAQAAAEQPLAAKTTTTEAPATEPAQTPSESS